MPRRARGAARARTAGADARVPRRDGPRVPVAGLGALVDDEGRRRPAPGAIGHRDTGGRAHRRPVRGTALMVPRVVVAGAVIPRLRRYRAPFAAGTARLPAGVGRAVGVARWESRERRDHRRGIGAGVARGVGHRRRRGCRHRRGSSAARRPGVARLSGAVGQGSQRPGTPGGGLVRCFGLEDLARRGQVVPADSGWVDELADLLRRPGPS